MRDACLMENGERLTVVAVARRFFILSFPSLKIRARSGNRSAGGLPAK